MGGKRQQGAARPAAPEPARRSSADFVPAPIPLPEVAVIDIEATSLNPSEAELLEVAAYVVPTGLAFGPFLVRPATDPPEEVLALTGISLSEITARGREPREVLEALAGFVGDRPLVAHNGRRFDFPVLEQACARWGVHPPPGPRLDTLELAHLVFPRAGAESPDADGAIPPPSRRLDDLARHFGIPSPDAPHRAASDAALTAALWEVLLAELRAETPVRDLQRWMLLTGGHPLSSVLGVGGRRRGIADIVAPGNGGRSATASGAPGGQAGVFDIDAAVAPLADGGALMTDGRSPRPVQLQMARAVAESLAGGTATVVEAPTGTGKTLAYLVPAVGLARATEDRRPVLVAPHSRVLQNQIARTLAELDRALGPVRWAVLKGVSNYVSVAALEEALREAPGSPDEAFALAVVCGWAAATPTGDWEDLRTVAVEDADPEPWRQLRHDLSVATLELGPGDPLAPLCFHRRAIDAVADADVAVLNHAVLCSRPEWQDLAPPVVIDEAHCLEDAATSAFTEELSAETITRTLLGIGHARRHAGRTALLTVWRRAVRDHLAADRANPLVDGVRRAVDNCLAQATAFGDALTEWTRAKTGATREEAAEYPASCAVTPLERRAAAFAPVRVTAFGLFDALEELDAALAGLAREVDAPGAPPESRTARHRAAQRIINTRRRLHETRRVLRRAVAPQRSAGDDDAPVTPGATTAAPAPDVERVAVAKVRWNADQQRWGWSVALVPVVVGPLLAAMWARTSGLVLTSATLRVGGSFQYIRTTLGLPAATRELALDTPFVDLHERHLVVLPNHLPVPRASDPSQMAAFVRAATAELCCLIRIARGGTLGLFTSHRRLREVGDGVREELRAHGLRVLVQGDGPSGQLVEQMQAERDTSLLGTRSFWEGVDLPGDTLRLLVLEKLPFEPPDDPVTAARADFLALRAGRDAFWDYLLPRAVITFAQGMGRLIRTQDDRGAAVVLDARLRRPLPYAMVFLEALPGPPTVLRPATAEEGWAAVARHLGRDLDEALLADLIERRGAHDWADLRGAAAGVSDPARLDELATEAARRLGIEELRSEQQQGIRALLSKKDLLFVAPTGFGKSVVFQVAAILGEGLSVVVSPLIALMRDQVQALVARGFDGVAGLWAGMSASEQEEVLARVRSGDVGLLYVSPERLWSARLRSALAATDVWLVAVDEAHCVSQWGHSFRPEYAIVPEALAQVLEPRPVVAAFTATAPPQVRSDITGLLQLEAPVDVAVPADRPELRYVVEDCSSPVDRDDRVLAILEAFQGRPVIVYVPRRADTLRLAALLGAVGHRARPYHGGMDASLRTHIEEQFRAGEITCVVATKAFGLGIDNPDIAAVVHLEMPASLEEYIQETGRAARGAARGEGPPEGWCVLLRTPRDCGIHRHFIRAAAPTVADAHAVWDALGNGDSLVDLEALATRSGRDQLALELALHHLWRSGAVERFEDVAVEGRLHLPPDLRRRLADARSLAPACRSLAALLASAVDAGEREMTLDTVARRSGLPLWELEPQLLELQRAEVLAFMAWRYAHRVRRAPGGDPDWTKVEAFCREVADRARERSEEALAYRDNTRRCRRAVLLEHLGQPAPTRCDGCDVCVPGIARPWAGVRVDRAALTEERSLEPDVLRLLAAHGGRFSLRNLARTLVGDLGGRYPLPQELQESPVLGQAGMHTVDEILREIENLEGSGAVRVEVRQLADGTTYRTASLTRDGWRKLVTLGWVDPDGWRQRG